ncbi:MAG: poly-gamma-glutamate synthesis protein (capsule biosynthesis protein) [Candidatus Magnetoglobus multicellularis str. Araruama]|uniref:Poly-gamma-glutamate synthesis protein (Capsule biosynthesis protein) n=1 Tax=Candidatus Magnetoglobus multicellularis str. Araruama TaxID=890399 RepID=A0A1V1PGY3_9BACT|nr:MAG: poly-gamma-glutamate synthesis protein (capsule biosynthesis protein) [Candidatus Magnetoglobus multicellularis str. Araruama]
MDRILFLGDLLYDYNFIQKDIETMGLFFKKNNFFVIPNLEAPLKSNNPRKKWINLYNHSNIIQVLKLLNVFAVNIANNHIMDWNNKGLFDLIQQLKKADIKYFGAGNCLDEAISPCIIGLNQTKIGISGFGWKEEMCVPASHNKPGVAPLKISFVEKAIQIMTKNNVDQKVIHLHWGYEYEFYPLPIHRKLVHQMIDLGADLIIGHHAHVIQAIETYRNKKIYYGLGNYYFGSRRVNFDTCKNPIGEQNSRFGLGIIWDTYKFETILFDSFNNNTRLIDSKKYPLIDITHIPLSSYNSFFRKNRVSTRKPSLYISKYAFVISIIKLYWCKNKELLVKYFVILLDKIGLKEFVRKIYYKNKELAQT